MTIAMVVAASLAGVAGSWLLYLVSPRQQWLAGSLRPANRFAWLGGLCLLASLALMLPIMGSMVAVSVWLTLIMLIWSVAPFLGAWRARYRRRSS